MPAVVIANTGDVPEFEGRITFNVIVCVVIAACGGLMFGYDIGVSAALIASFIASKTCSKYGRKPTMQLASIFFIIGVALTTFAVNIEMLIIGRLHLGLGVGFANQAVPLFLSELAPAKIRGALNISFQLFITIGILIANVVNYAVGKIHPYGFRISLGIAGVPALMLCLGSLAIHETPTSLIERKKVEEGRAVLKKIRGCR
ncbi:hypothetical protein OIU84_021442 [Salix udensis]|uniref:Major facilitator superfamily (MFS) profile domain-containing protein n=1 Tax=Salix udensis TaxID=889485 RepID=A0AAD6KUM1_9ROSI|nr:hypothetical protein OIU84_021442 [Salix udensis]